LVDNPFLAGFRNESIHLFQAVVEAKRLERSLLSICFPAHAISQIPTKCTAWRPLREDCFVLNVDSTLYGKFCSECVTLVVYSWLFSIYYGLRISKSIACPHLACYSNSTQQ